MGLTPFFQKWTVMGLTPFFQKWIKWTVMDKMELDIQRSP